MDYAQDGDLSQIDDDDIADAMQWGGEPAAMIEALLSCGMREYGFLERDNHGHLILHNWDEHCGVRFKQRAQGAERIRRHREKQSRNADVTRYTYVSNANVTRGEERRGDEMKGEEMRGDEMRGDEMKREEKRGEERRGEETPPPAPAPATGGAIFGNPSDQGPKRQSKSEPPMTPLPDGPFDMKTFMALQEMYWCVGDEYIPDPGAEIRLIQELTEEYPAVPLFQEFRKARAWLEAHPEKVRNDLRLFLRKWINKAEKQYVQYETVFVPVKEGPGGG